MFTLSLETGDVKCNGQPLPDSDKVDLVKSKLASKSKKQPKVKKSEMSNIELKQHGYGTTNRYYCFTSFKRVEFSHYENVYNEHKNNIRYLLCGRENCPSSDRIHIQGYIQLIKPLRWTTVKNYLGDPSLHIQKCKGTPDDNYKYCTKEGCYKSWGELYVQGTRTDIKAKINECATLDNFIQQHTDVYVRYRSGIEGYYRSKGVDYVVNDDKPITIWLYGETGTGKSRTIKDFIKLKAKEGYRAWRRPLGANSWFDGYAGQDIVFLDEIRGSTYKFDDLLQMLDYDCSQVPIKGGFTSFNPKIVLITSNRHPRDIYEHINDENKDQLVRRCDKIIHLTCYIPDLLTNLE